MFAYDLCWSGLGISAEWQSKCQYQHPIMTCTVRQVYQDKGVTSTKL